MFFAFIIDCGARILLERELEGYWRSVCRCCSIIITREYGIIILLRGGRFGGRVEARSCGVGRLWKDLIIRRVEKNHRIIFMF